MFRSELPPIQARSKSSQAHSFRLKLNRLKRQTNSRIQDRPVSVLFWCPSKNRTDQNRIRQVAKIFSGKNIRPFLSHPPAHVNTEKAVRHLKSKSENMDIVFVFIRDNMDLFSRINKEKGDISELLFIFAGDEIERQYIQILKNSKKITSENKFKPYLEENDIYRISDLMKSKVTYSIEQIKLIKHIQDKVRASCRDHISLSDVHEKYKNEISLFTNETWLFILTFIRYLKREEQKEEPVKKPEPVKKSIWQRFREAIGRMIDRMCAKSVCDEKKADPEDKDYGPKDERTPDVPLYQRIKTEIKKHVFISDVDLDACFDYFDRNGFIDRSSFPGFTNRGEAFLYMFDLRTLPTLADEKSAFQEKWTSPLTTTVNSFYKLPDDVGSLARLADDVYFRIAGQYKWFRVFRYLFCKYLWGWWTPEEKKYVEHKLGKMIFSIWRENIGGVRRGFKPESEEKAEFFRFLFENLEVKWLPENSKKFQDHRMTIFSLRVLRTNPFAHLYVNMPFTMMLLKDRIKEYMILAMRTGEYDFLLKKYQPYHHILNLYVAPGDRTFVDTRMIDYWPYSYKLDLKWTAALSLNRIPTRSNKRFVSCDFEIDENLEDQKQGLIKKLSKEINDFPPTGFTNFEIRDDGNIYINREFFPNYGPRRNNFRHINDELAIQKVLDTPSPKSGLVIRFNLLDPIAILVGGIDGERRFSIDDMIYLLKCLELLKKNVHKRDVGKTIDEIFDHPFPKAVSKATTDIIHQIAQLRKNEPDDEAAWEFLTPELVKGNFKPLNQVINHCLIGDGFEFIFSLWPLLTGKEIPIAYNDGQIEIKEQFAEILLEKQETADHTTNGEKTTTEKIKVSKKEKEGKNEYTKTPDQKKDLLPLIDILKCELEMLLKNVFSKNLDISAATKRFRSEPILAGMIVEFCLNPKSDRDSEYKIKIEKHLKKHYLIHYTFLKEYLAYKKDNDTALQLIYNLNTDNTDIFEQSAEDAGAIVDLISATRNRLLRREENNRLLRFIDPKSVDVQIGNFTYGGNIVEEEDFLMKHQQLLSDLGNLQKKYDYDIDHKIRTINMERESITRDTTAHKYKTDREREQIEADLVKMFSEIKLKAFESVMEGNIRDYAQLALIKAHQDGGIDEVERILDQSPNLIMAINPHIHHEQEKREIKHHLIKMMEKDTSLFNPGVASMVLDKPFKEVIESEIYKKFANRLTDVLEIEMMTKDIRLGGQVPQGNKGGGKDSKGPEGNSTNKGENIQQQMIKDEEDQS